MADEAQPLPGQCAAARCAQVAWKTGTSYGYRDAWAIGVNARYIIGIWTGRPDGTPVVGQFGLPARGAITQPRSIICYWRATGRLPEDPRPQTVSRGVICWPGGRTLPAGDSNCRRRGDMASR